MTDRTLFVALWSMVASGATLDAIADQPELLALVRVRNREPDAVKERQAQLARNELIEACKAVDNQGLAVKPIWTHQGAAVLALLGLATGLQNARESRRRGEAASVLGYPTNTAFKSRPGAPSHVEIAVSAVASKLWERDIEARAGAAAGLVRQTRTGMSELAVDMLRRYEAYYAMYTPLVDLRADLAAALDMRRSGDDELNRLSDFVACSLYDYARFLLAKRDFTERYKGVWVFADAGIEQGVRDAIHLIEHFSGLRYRDESLMRLEAAKHHELHRFIETLESNALGQQALRRWRDRIVACRCDRDDQPLPECRLHKLMNACGFYALVLDTDWYRMIPWHNGPPPNMGMVDPATLYDDIWLRQKPPLPN